MQPAASPISIRRASPDDALGILECLWLAFEPYRDSYTPAAFEDTVLSPGTIQDRMTEMSVFVAVTGTGDIAGTVGGRTVGCGEGHIRGMAVHPAVVGTRVAQSLLEAVENELRQRGCTRVTLDTTRPLERAVRFYVRNGFRFTGVVRDFFGMPLFEYVKELQVEQVTMTADISHEVFIKQALALAGEARAQGNHPFGALLVVDGRVVLTARNSVVTDADPTAHAETNLVALAIRHLPADQIRRAVLYTSCEPCAMCAGKMYWAGIRSVVYGLPGEELATLAGGDFLVPCRDLFLRAIDRVEVHGPVLVAEARTVHVGFWPSAAV
jgi:tRNA(Arg) A34 adenosine deaminase TadA/ribosomal protein S18 acetylase RimI-like enzyme